MIPSDHYWPVLLLDDAGHQSSPSQAVDHRRLLDDPAGGCRLGRSRGIDIRRTSETQAGQDLVAAGHTFAVGVPGAPVHVPHSSNLAAAYGIAVTGAMFVDTLLFFVIVRCMWKRPIWRALPPAASGCWTVFISSNLLKIPQGAWLPLVLGAAWC
jgi:KUP system potassium uptake protein